MTRAHALELVLTDADDQAVRTRWQDLERAGMPSLTQHRGATHRPHLTLASSPSAPDRSVLDRARHDWGSLLPLTIPVSGLAVLGGRRVTIAELCCPPVQVQAAQAALVAAWAEADQRPWVPHISLSTSLPPDAAGTALQALLHSRVADVGAGGERDGGRTFYGLRWWDPEQERVTTVAGAGG